ncbi:MAG: hypothetical protein LBT09_02670 [Planctomycetaceae bacterium]|jgi:flagellar biogenesis protein FliO|nr:hypothetical protein [Planctomycetaceae bacterium]
MNTQRHFLHKILIAAVIFIFWQNIHICPADNTSDSSNSDFDRNHYGQDYRQDQYDRQQNNQPNNTNPQNNNPNLSSVNFGQDLSGNSIREPLPLPPKPAVNDKKNNQLNALKNSINNPPTQIRNPTHHTTPANYTANKTTQTPIKFAAAESVNNTNDQAAAELSPDSTPDTRDGINVTEKQNTKNADTILDQKITFNKNDNNNKKLSKPRMSEFFGPVVSVVASLLIVISVFLIFTFLFRKISPNAVQNLPKEVFENLGKTFLSQKLQVHLLRLGNRLILVSAANDTLTPIAEITDPDEVVAVLGMCRQLNNDSINKFHQNLSAQLNSSNHSRNNNIAPNNSAKNYTPKNNPNNYFGTEQIEQDEIRNHKRQYAHGVDMYSEPDNSLAAILASGLERKGIKS